MAVDHNWSRRGQRSSVQMVGDVSALYYPKKETGDSTRPAQRVHSATTCGNSLFSSLSQL